MQNLSEVVYHFVMKVIPAPLAYTSEDVLRQFNLLFPYFKRFQIDIQDGKFITNKTVPLETYLFVLEKMDQKKIKMLTFDFHFQSLSYVEDIKTVWNKKDSLKIGIHLIHYSLKPDFEKLKKTYPDFSFGLVLNPEDSVEEVVKNYKLHRPRGDRPLVETIDGIQIMSIHPGPQGTPFMPETLTKIEQLHQSSYRSDIYLDGGINLATLPVIKKHRHTPDFLCIGSYLTKSSNIAIDVQKLNEELSASPTEENVR